MDAETVRLTIEARVDEANRKIVQHGDVVEGTMSKVETSATRAEQSIRRSATLVVDNTGRIANAQRNLGRQIADVGASLSSGSSPFMVLAQQAPQVADALTDMGGRASKVAAFFTGPWGAALLAAGSIVGVLAGKALEAGVSVDSLREKLEANAEKARMAETAQKQFESSLYGAAKASAELNQRLAIQNKTQLQVAQSALAAAEATRQSNLQNLRKEASEAATQLTKLENIRAGQRRGNAFSTPESEAADQAAAAVYAERLAAAKARQAVAQKGLSDAEKAVVQARVPLLDIKAAAASDANAAAALRHEEALGKLRDQFTKTGNEAAYLAGRERIDKQLSEEQTAIKDKEKTARQGAAAARREEAKAARELAAAQKELQQTLEQITGRYDPAKKAAADFNETLKQIDDLRLAGLISATDALTYKLAAAAQQAKTIADIASRTLDQQLGYTIGGNDDPVKKGGFDMDTVIANADRRRDAEMDANDRIAADLRDKQESQIRTVANLYEDMFRGGTKAIWSDFKSIGLRVIAETLARFTIGQLSGNGGSLGSALKSITGSISGGSGGGFFDPFRSVGGGIGGGLDGARASGGPVSAGKTYLVGEKGPELFTAPSSGSIVPNSALAASAMANTRAVAPVGAPQSGTIRVQIMMDNDVFTARVQEASAPVAVEVVRQSAPSIMQGAANQAINTMSRPRI
ncbi:phage tail length tape measure family protein [Sphingobium sp. H39-3-25]|uniref:phage tail length tape measure family protein n=1 Tax=Sphingobium arseniciresistens TaxID=3030834 RepID=UPI0023BA140D|nr:phage tail length tape measure family protein [Sphingobium arseniciresistens]